MDNEFKIPTLDPKFKAPAKKPDDKVDDASESENKSTIDSIQSPEKVTEKPKVTNKPDCPYKVPKWSKPPNSELIYKFEVLKQGQIEFSVENLQNKAFWTIGKLPNNDIKMEHPTVSRHHAVLQYLSEARHKDGSDNDDDDEDDKESETTEKPQFEKGWYLYDLTSTHGSFVNKKRIPPKTYVPVRVGYFLKFGGSTKSFILQGPDSDAEPESELTITEMKELRIQKQQEFEQKRIEEEKRREEEAKRKEEEGISWGMADDAEEETDLSINPFATSMNEDLFLDDPKKTLRGYFEREGLDLEYKVDEISNGTYLCRVELPITDAIGRTVVAEFTHKGKKKDCVAQCALEACRILDRNGLLRQANHEPRKRKVESSDDDDDDFYDRTTAAEEKRRRKAGDDKEVVLSYEQLLEEEKKLQSRLVEIEERIERYKMVEKQTKESGDAADLDVYMSGLSNEKVLDKTDIRKYRFELQQIKADIVKVNRMIKIARPVDLIPIAKQGETGTSMDTKKKLELPLFGKKRTFGFAKLKAQTLTSKSAIKKTSAANQGESIEEFDDDDDGDNDVKKVVSIKNETLSDEIIIMNDEKMPATPSSPAVTTTATTQPNQTEQTPENQSNKVNNVDKVKTIQNTAQQSSEVPKSKTTMSNDSAEVKKPLPFHVDLTNRKTSKQLRKLVDIDDSEEDKKKFSQWLPPKDQSGDGVTHLNAKFGY